MPRRKPITPAQFSAMVRAEAEKKLLKAARAIVDAYDDPEVLVFSDIEDRMATLRKQVENVEAIR